MTTDDGAVTQRQFADVASNVDKLGVKLDSMSELMDQRMKSIEQRIDMGGRQQDQTTRLLAEALSKLQETHNKTIADLSEERRLSSVLRAEFDDFKDKVEHAQENTHNNIRSLVQALVGGAIALAASMITIYFTKLH